MPFIPVTNVAELHVRGTLLGQDVENSFYYEKNSAILQSDLQTLVDNCSFVVESDWIPLLSTSWIGREVYARDLTTSIAAQATNNDIDGAAGEIGGECTAAFNTIAISRRSGLTGRSARGRIYWMGIPEAWMVGNGLGGGTTTAIILALEALDAAAVTAGFNPVIVSKYTAGAPRASGLIFDLVDWVAVDSLVDTRRSRKVGSGS